jgi:hypothetical protein
VEKTINIVHSEFVFAASGIQHSMRMRHIAICGLLALHFLPTYLINGTTFLKKIVEHKKHFDFLYKLCLTNFSLEKELSEIWSEIYRVIQ